MIVAYSPNSRKWANYDELHRDAASTMPAVRPLLVKKSHGLPFGVFDVNEDSKKGILDMLEAIQKKSGLSPETFSGKARIIQGDWATVNNLRGAQRDRSDDVNNTQRLDYAVGFCSLWHFALSAVYMLDRTLAMRCGIQARCSTIKAFLDVRGTLNDGPMQRQNRSFGTL